MTVDTIWRAVLTSEVHVHVLVSRACCDSNSCKFLALVVRVQVESPLTYASVDLSVENLVQWTHGASIFVDERSEWAYQLTCAIDPLVTLSTRALVVGDHLVDGAFVTVP